MLSELAYQATCQSIRDAWTCLHEQRRMAQLHPERPYLNDMAGDTERVLKRLFKEREIRRLRRLPDPSKQNIYNGGVNELSDSV